MDTPCLFPEEQASSWTQKYFVEALDSQRFVITPFLTYRKEWGFAENTIILSVSIYPVCEDLICSFAELHFELTAADAAMSSASQGILQNS